MDKTHLAYFEDEDILHLAISDEPEAVSVEFTATAREHVRHEHV